LTSYLAALSFASSAWYRNDERGFQKATSSCNFFFGGSGTGTNGRFQVRDRDGAMTEIGRLRQFAEPALSTHCRHSRTAVVGQANRSSIGPLPGYHRRPRTLSRRQVSDAAMPDDSTPGTSSSWGSGSNGTENRVKRRVGNAGVGIERRRMSLHREVPTAFQCRNLLPPSFPCSHHKVGAAIGCL